MDMLVLQDISLDKLLPDSTRSPVVVYCGGKLDN